MNPVAEGNGLLATEAAWVMRRTEDCEGRNNYYEDGQDPCSPWLVTPGFHTRLFPPLIARIGSGVRSCSLGQHLSADPVEEQRPPGQQKRKPGDLREPEP